MTHAARRLAELDRIARQRPLTDDEQREVMLRARQERRNITRRLQYWINPDYRDAQVRRVRAYRAGLNEAATC